MNELTQEREAELRAKYDRFIVNFDKKVKPEEFAYEWDGYHFIQRYKFNAITATGLEKVAAGKSMFCFFLIASSMLKEVPSTTKGQWLKCFIKNCRCLYVDAEMGESSTQAGLFRILATCRYYDMPVPYRYKKRIHSRSVYGLDADEMFEAVEWYIYDTKPDLVFLDNMVFFLPNMDVNGPDAAKYIAKFDALCKKYSTTIIMVSHGNKAADDNNLAGVAGTAIMRLAAYIMAISEGDLKDPGAYKKVKTLKARQGGFPPDHELFFHFEPFEYKGITSVFPRLGKPVCATDIKLTDQELFIKIFGNSSTLRYKELILRIQNELGINTANAEKRVKSARQNKLILKNSESPQSPYVLNLPSLPS